jgi:hypothetical protein
MRATLESMMTADPAEVLNVQSTLSEHSVNIRSTFGPHSFNIRSTFSKKYNKIINASAYFCRGGDLHFECYPLPSS